MPDKTVANTTLFLQCPHRQGKRRQKGRSQLQCNVPLPLVEKMPPVVGEQGRGLIFCPVGRKAHSSSNSVTLQMPYLVLAERETGRSPSMLLQTMTPIRPGKEQREHVQRRTVLPSCAIQASKLAFVTREIRGRGIMNLEYGVAYLTKPTQSSSQIAKKVRLTG